MEHGLMVEGMLGGGYRELLAAARLAEQAGLVSFARSDHYFWPGPVREATDALITLAGLARDTELIRLAVMVSPVTFRHPAVLAKSAATLDQMSGGRFDLGLGTGWIEEEHQVLGLPYPAMAERFERLEETAGYLRAAFSPQPVGYSGRHYRLEARPIRPTPTGLSMIIGGRGPTRTPRLAGLYADEYNHMLGTPPEEIAARFALARQVAEEAGRDPGALRLSVMGPVLVGRNQAEYRRRLELEAEWRGRDPERIEADYRAAGRPCGPIEQASEALAALAATGAQRFYIQHFPLGDLASLATTLDLVLGR